MEMKSVSKRSNMLWWIMLLGVYGVTVSVCGIQAECPVCYMVTPMPCNSTHPSEGGPYIIDLRHRRLNRVDPAWFDDVDCSIYQYLYLTGNQITSLAHGIFDRLTSLVSLFLDRNRLTSLPQGLLDNATSLRTFAVSFNSLTELPANVFDSTNQLSELRLDDNALRSLRLGVFDHVPELTILKLNDNALTSLPVAVFDHLPRMDNLRLNNNAITSLPKGIFDGLLLVTKLLLNSNLLTFLYPGVFDELRNLYRLTIHDNPTLSSIHAGIFDKLENLDDLRLDNITLTSLPHGIFDSLTQLTNLQLNGNFLSALPVAVFEGLVSLRTLRLDHNNLTALPKDVFQVFQNGSNFREGRAGYNPFECLPSPPHVVIPATFSWNGTCGAVAVDFCADVGIRRCFNGGTCVNGEFSFVCECVSGFTGELCSLPSSNHTMTSNHTMIYALIAVLGIVCLWVVFRVVLKAFGRSFVSAGEKSPCRSSQSELLLPR